MKKNFYLSGITLALSIFACVFAITSCSKEETATPEEASNENSIYDQKKKTSENSQLSSRTCFIEVGYYEVQYGKKIVLPPFCEANLSSICAFRGLGYIPRFVICPDWRIPDCQVIDCLNPWNFKNIFINPIPRYSDLFKGDPSPQPSIGGILIKVTPDIAILQFNNELKNIVDKQLMTVKNNFDLPKDFAQKVGLNGYNVPAGIYPVVYDQLSKTYNAIVRVK
jgi:hypothetical protein